MNRRAALLRSLPLLPAVVVLIALLAILRSDPATGVTGSTSPFTDEAFNGLNARNLALFGAWSTDDWNLQLVNGPYSLAAAGVLRLLGVEIEPLRLLATLLSVGTVALTGLLVASRLGRWAGCLAAVALGGNALLLYYGRLALLEPMVMLLLLAGTVLLVLAPAARCWPSAAAAGLLLGLAIATKPSAAFAVAGLLAGATLGAGWRDRRSWNELAAPLAGIATVAAGWLLLIGLPNWQAVLVDLRIWPAETAPADIAQAFQRIGDYFGASDRAIPYLLTLWLAAFAGVGFAIRGWRGLDRRQRRLIGLAAGWLVVGAGLLLIVPYRPNRYLLPMLPALAILAGVAGAGVLRLLRGDGAKRAVALAALGIGTALPGASAYVSWARSATFELEAGQQLVEQHVAPGEVIEGELAPTLGWHAPVIISVSRPADGINASSEAARRVRWRIVAVDASEVAHRPDVVGCIDWGGRQACLVPVP
jgi:4-amino-4-deoxy-L-arabinose transferase-like glycosyltransferase